MSLPVNTPTVDACGSGRFRDLMSLFPAGVVVVTAQDDLGVPHGATCSTLTSVTLQPPTLLVCLREGLTLKSIRSSGVFAVNMLASAGVNIARRFSSALVDKFAEVPWRSWGNLPHLSEGTFAVVSCRLSELITVGDHTITLGVVTDILSFPGRRPLMYRQRAFASWPEPDDQRQRTSASDTMSS